MEKYTTINIMEEIVIVSKEAKYLGVWIDEHLSMSKQINSICSYGYMMLKNIWKISSKLNNIELKKQLIHSCILSKLNFCSSLYFKLPKKNSEN